VWALDRARLQKNLVNTNTYLSCDEKNDNPLKRIGLPILENLQKESHVVLQNRHKGHMLVVCAGK
jgi:hypothetical protein